VPFEAVVETMEPERLFSFRWRPYSPDPENANVPMTLVEFVLERDGEGTYLRVSESGFGLMSAKARAEMFRRNSNGWTYQMYAIEKYLRDA
jgi:hypothetical protein